MYMLLIKNAKPQPGHKLPERKRPPHSSLWNAQLTWSSSLLPNVFHPPPPATLLSYPSPLAINKVGLRASLPLSLRLPLVLYPGLTSLFWKFALQTRKCSKTFFPLLLLPNTLRFTPYLWPVLPQLFYPSN